MSALAIAGGALAMAGGALAIPAAARRFPRSGNALLATLVMLACAAPAAAADPSRGSGVYAAHCAVCHGANGRPTWPGAPDFSRPGSLLQPDARLLAVIRNGRGVMPGYVGVLKDRELLDLLAYLRTLG